MTDKELNKNNLDKDLYEAVIEEMEDRDHVRLRPGMYLPDINYCVYEVLDNAIDEHMAGNGNEIYIKISPDGLTEIQDFGGGIPITPSKKQPKKTQFEVALSSLKAGGKFNQDSSQVKSGGLHGVGAAAVNFTCKKFNAVVAKYDKKTDSTKYYGIEWEEGLIKEGFHEITDIDSDVKHGTYVELLPDDQIWKGAKYNIDAINKRIEQLSFLNPRLTLYVDIDYEGKVINTVYSNPQGLVNYIEKLNNKKEQIVDVVSINTEMNDKTLGNVEVSLALSYNTGYNEEIYAFTNNIPNADGGHHLTGFKDGLYKAIKEYYLDNVKGKAVDIISADVREGLTAVVSVKMADPNFIGQGKAKLDAPKLRSVVRELTEESLNDYLDKNPEKAKLIVSKALQAQNTRESVRKARESARSVKNLFGGTPAKLTTCTSKNPEECEIWFAEGDSAGGSCKKARNKTIQAILPVFGKINNTENMNLKQIVDSVKLREVISALGCSIGEDFDIEKLRYHKIIIASDADDDGLHIQTLWLNFFYRHMRPLLENGHVYISCPPLFKVVKNKKEHRYCYTIAEKDAVLKEEGWSKADVFRFKGLGEMEPADLRESTMNPETRVLLQVTLSDLAESDEEVMVACMGDDVSLRKQLILDEEEIELM